MSDLPGAVLEARPITWRIRLTARRSASILRPMINRVAQQRPRQARQQAASLGLCAATIEAEF